MIEPLGGRLFDGYVAAVPHKRRLATHEVSMGIA